jgi:septal ring factor EnvC (AmiA/AmiB activator)
MFKLLSNKEKFKNYGSQKTHMDGKLLWKKFVYILKLRKTQAILLGIILCISLFILVVRPSFIGFTTYQEMKNSNYSITDYTRTISELEKDIEINNLNLSNCQSFRQELYDEFEKYLEKISSCETDLRLVQVNSDTKSSILEKEIDSLKSQVDGKDEELTLCRQERKSKENELIFIYESEISELKEEISDCDDSWSEDYDELARTSAKNICCKIRVDNPSIDSYFVQNNKIVCTSGGSNLLSC